MSRCVNSVTLNDSLKQTNERIVEKASSLNMKPPFLQRQQNFDTLLQLA